METHGDTVCEHVDPAENWSKDPLTVSHCDESNVGKEEKRTVRFYFLSCNEGIGQNSGLNVLNSIEWNYK